VVVVEEELVSAFPPASTATQNLAVGQDTEFSATPGSIEVGVDQVPVLYVTAFPE
jgi:hypothetical protein